MIITKESHLDHGLTKRQVEYIARKYEKRNAFFIDEFRLPPHLGTVESGLYGPLVGDPQITEDVVTYQNRGNRKGPSRLIALPPRKQKWVTVIGGPSDSGEIILYTAYGGPLAPREPWDVEHDPKLHAESLGFWAEHALSEKS